MPRRLNTGLEKTGNEGGTIPCGPAVRPCDKATCSLSNTHLWRGFHNHASGSSVGIKISSGHGAPAKYWWRQGAGSTIGIWCPSAAPSLVVAYMQPLVEGYRSSPPVCPLKCRIGASIAPERVSNRLYDWPLSC